MIWLDGFGYNKFGTHGLLWTDAAPNLLVFAIVATVFVIRGTSLRSSPAPLMLTSETSRPSEVMLSDVEGRRSERIVGNLP